MFRLSTISPFFASLLLFAIWLLFLVLFLWITTVHRLYCHFASEIVKMSLAEALHGMLAVMPINQVLAEDIGLEVVVQDGRLEIRETKKPQKVSTLLKVK